MRLQDVLHAWAVRQIHSDICQARTKLRGRHHQFHPALPDPWLRCDNCSHALVRSDEVTGNFPYGRFPEREYKFRSLPLWAVGNDRQLLLQYWYWPGGSLHFCGGYCRWSGYILNSSPWYYGLGLRLLPGQDVYVPYPGGQWPLSVFLPAITVSLRYAYFWHDKGSKYIHWYSNLTGKVVQTSQFGFHRNLFWSVLQAGRSLHFFPGSDRQEARRLPGVTILFFFLLFE